MFNHAVRICISPHMASSLLEVITKLNIVSSFKYIFERNVLFVCVCVCVCGPLCARHIHNVSPCYLVLSVATLVVIKAEKPASLIEFFTY
jgi:hypothetical protein